MDPTGPALRCAVTSGVEAGNGALMTRPSVSTARRDRLLDKGVVPRRRSLLRRVRIIERTGETYTYAAVDRDTGEVPLQLTDRAALVALCRRLGWAVHQNKGADEPPDERPRQGVSATAIIGDAE